MGRLPRNHRVEDPPSMRLVARDVEILKAVHDCRVLRGDQIQTLFFGCQSTASYRLSRLYQHGFLERHFLPTLGGLASSPILYTLGKRGVDVLRQALGGGPEEGRRWSGGKELSPLFLEHMLAINTVRIAITKACQGSRFRLLTWRGENELKANYDYVNIRTPTGRLKSVSVIPDSYFRLETPRGIAHFFLELDRGTMTTQRFQAKVQAYQAYYQSGAYQKRYEARGLRVLTVTVSWARATNLQRVTEEAEGKQRFWFTILDEIKPETILSKPIWKVATQENRAPLIEV